MFSRRGFLIGVAGLLRACQALSGYRPLRRQQAAYTLTSAISLLDGGIMTGKSITRVDLYTAVYESLSLSRSEALALVEAVLKEITDTLEKGETVKLASFGSFIVRKKGQRMGRNPKTGAEATVSARRVVVFKPSGILKQQLNGKRPAPRKPVAELGSSAPAR